MKIVFNVPDGEYCLDCPHQEKFGVEEIEITTLGDSFHRYTRIIIANCHLFNEKITGTSFEKWVNVYHAKSTELPIMVILAAANKHK